MEHVFSRRGSGTAILLTLSGLAMAAPDTLPPLQDPIAEFARFSGAPDASRCTAGPLALPVDLAEGNAFEATVDQSTGRLKILYRTNFNQVTEGWNWHPEANAEKEDYYRFKYLPIGSFSEDKGAYRFEDKIGEPEEVKVRWRYVYYFAFDNLYDFFPRTVDDDAGFHAEIPLPVPDAERLTKGDLRMALRGRLSASCITDSTTFWKATHGKPVDFTLKKRYLVGQLDEVWFYDVATKRILARLTGQRKQANATGL